MSERSVNLAILAIGIIAVSTAAVMIREADAPAMVIAAYRVGLASLPLLLLAGLKRDRVLPRDGTLIALTVLSGICLAVHFGFWVASVKQTSIVTSVVLVTTTPLFVGLAGGPLLGERPGRSIWLAIAVSAAGTVLLVSEDFDAGGDTLTGDVFALLGALFAAGYIMTGRRVLGAGKAWLPYVTASYSIAAVVLLASALATGEALERVFGENLRSAGGARGRAAAHRAHVGQPLAGPPAGNRCVRGRPGRAGLRHDPGDDLPQRGADAATARRWAGRADRCGAGCAR